jgi:intraflagellar transport protein 81
VSEHQLLSIRQRLMDAQKQARENLGPEQMLNNLRNEVRQNREIAQDVIGRELNDKKERLQRIEMVLQEPGVTQSELERLTSDVKRLQREVSDLNGKISQNTPADDKLAIYKSQANAVSKKKEQKAEELKKVEVEKLALEKTMREKEEQYQKLRGSKYLKRDDFKQYAATLRVKNNAFKSMKKALDEVKAEVTVLDRTKQILKERAGDVEELMKELERKKGIQGYSQVEDKIQGVSELKEQLDNAKSRSLQELTALVQQIDAECKDKKNRLAPEIKKLRTLRTKFTEIEQDYNDKKRAYEHV